MYRLVFFLSEVSHIALPFETVQHIAAWQVYRCDVRALHRHVARPLGDLVVCPEQTHQHCRFCFDAAGFSQRASTESPVGLQAAQPSRPELDLRGPAPPFAGFAARAHLYLLDCRRLFWRLRLCLWCW